MNTMASGAPGILAGRADNEGDDRMTGLKVMGVFWVAAIAATPVVGQIPESMSKKLMTGSTQVVLSIVVLGLTGGIIWVVKRLLKSNDDRVADARLNAEKQVEQARGHTSEMTKALSDNSTALAQNATASQQLKEAVFHLSEVVDKKLDRT